MQRILGTSQHCYYCNLAGRHSSNDHCVLGAPQCRHHCNPLGRHSNDQATFSMLHASHASVTDKQDSSGLLPMQPLYKVAFGKLGNTLSFSVQGNRPASRLLLFLFMRTHWSPIGALSAGIQAADGLGTWSAHPYWSRRA